MRWPCRRSSSRRPWAPAYPLDGDAATGIRRLTHARLVQAGQLPGPKQPPGERLSLDQVDLRLLGQKDLDLPRSDPELTREVVGLLGRMADRYAIAVLDVSDPAAPRYAEHGGEVRRNPGSVGKLCAALAVFQALADVYPQDEAARVRVLRDSMITADAFVLTDSHSVRLYQPQGKTLIRRPLRVGDRGSLFEFLDWMLSASSNSAAAVVMQQAMLLRHFKTAYPVTPEIQGRFFRDTPRGELARLYIETFEAPLSRNGLDLKALRQGSFFTHEGKRRVPGSGPSYGTARELMKFLLRMEQGRLVDAFSSREMKRLTYMTERRIRYASSPALSDAAVYFKSGSLYKCAPGSRMPQVPRHRHQLHELRGHRRVPGGLEAALLPRGPHVQCAGQELGRGPPDARHPAPPPHRKTPSDTATCGATMIPASERMRRVIHSPPDRSAATATAIATGASCMTQVL